MQPDDGQPTEVPDEALDARPTGTAGTPPSRDPEDPDAPGADNEEPEGLAGP